MGDEFKVMRGMDGKVSFEAAKKGEGEVRKGSFFRRSVTIGDNKLDREDVLKLLNKEMKIKEKQLQEFADKNMNIGEERKIINLTFLPKNATDETIIRAFQIYCGEVKTPKDSHEITEAAAPLIEQRLSQQNYKITEDNRVHIYFNSQSERSAWMNKHPELKDSEGSGFERETELVLDQSKLAKLIGLKDSRVSLFNDDINAILEKVKDKQNDRIADRVCNSLTSREEFKKDGFEIKGTHIGKRVMIDTNKGYFFKAQNIIHKKVPLFVRDEYDYNKGKISITPQEVIKFAGFNAELDKTQAWDIMEKVKAKMNKSASAAQRAATQPAGSPARAEQPKPSAEASRSSSSSSSASVPPLQAKGASAEEVENINAVAEGIKAHTLKSGKAEAEAKVKKAAPEYENAGLTTIEYAAKVHDVLKKLAANHEVNFSVKEVDNKSEIIFEANLIENRKLFVELNILGFKVVPESNSFSINENQFKNYMINNFKNEVPAEFYRAIFNELLESIKNS